MTRDEKVAEVWKKGIRKLTNNNKINNICPMQVFGWRFHNVWRLCDCVKALQKHHKKIQESLTVDGKVSYLMPIVAAVSPILGCNNPRWGWKQSPELLHREKLKNLSIRSLLTTAYSIITLKKKRKFPEDSNGNLKGMQWQNVNADFGRLWSPQWEGGFYWALRLYLWGAVS